MIQDTGKLYTDTVQIPSRFYPALIWGLSYQLAIKFNPTQMGVFKQEYNNSFGLAVRDDTETTPISIGGEWNYPFNL